MTNKNMKDFKIYLSKQPYVFLSCEDEMIRVNRFKAYEIGYFIKIIVPRLKRSNIYYDIAMIRRGVKSLINKPENRMFLDLEFSLPSNNSYHIPEIVQYGFVVEDKDGNVIMEDSSLVKPLRKSALNSRTLKFLSLEYKDFNNACSYIEFYQLLESCIRDYDVKIICWGKNDILTLEQSFKLYHLRPLDIRNRYMNLMQIMKNYYNYKQEMGLFNTYQELANLEERIQTHNAFEDAMVAREIFHIFKKRINEDEN
jgi:inhibitor of KinA sporulation pathway (predicted exonuclease)